MANFGRMQGFLEEGQDVQASLADSILAGDSFTYLGHLPTLERLIRSLFRKPIFQGALEFSKKQISERRALDKALRHPGSDFLENFLNAHEEDPRRFSDNDLLAQVISNVAAGGDTAGATMSGIIYQILQHPHVLERLQEKLDKVVQVTPVSWTIARTLPYLQAVIQESIRFHPGTLFALERVVPPEGLSINGTHVPSGTVVGMHMWVINRNKTTFGLDADHFVPGRWMQGTEESKEKFDNRTNRMNQSILSFGHGKRRCPGRELAMVEILKVIVTLFTEYDICLASEKLPTVVHSIFVRMKDFNVKISLRKRDRALGARQENYPKHR